MVLLPVVAGILLLAPGYAVDTLLCIVAFGLLFEWGGLARFESLVARLLYAGLGTSACAITLAVGNTVVEVVAVASALAVAVPGFLIVLLFKRARGLLESPLFTAALGLLICVGAMVSCGRLNGDGFTLIALLLVVWLVDTGAYFAGTYFGSRKLNQTLSPNKTWEGAIGGVILGLLACSFFDLYLGWLPLAKLEAWIGIALLATLGDLFESAVKRVADVKDSGDLLPGHGGLLDRLDSLVFAAPFVYFMLL